MEYYIEENPDRYSEFEFIWWVTDDENNIIAEGLAFSYDLAEIDANNSIAEAQ